MSREGANLASRSTTTPQYIMNALASTAQPLNMSSNGMIYITQVSGTTDGKIGLLHSTGGIGGIKQAFQQK